MIDEGTSPEVSSEILNRLAPGSIRDRYRKKSASRTRKTTTTQHADDDRVTVTTEETVDEEKEEAEIERQSRREMDAAMKDRVAVIFPETSEPDGSYPIKAGLNGRSFVIKRNEEVKLPRAVLNMLAGRTYKRYEPTGTKDSNGNVIYAERFAKRFPYQVVRDPA